jgi:hypothetical protein
MQSETTGFFYEAPWVICGEVVIVGGVVLLV